MAIYLYDGKILTEGNAIAIAEACCCDNELWKRCDNNADAAVITAGRITHDYAWLCLSSIWVKCYFSGTTTSSATSPAPDFLLQCGTTPTSCASLVGWPCSDDFGGTGCNTGSVGDTNNGIRWSNTIVSPSTQAVVGGALRMTVQPTGGSYVQAQLNNTSISGDLTLSVDLTVNGAKPTVGLDYHYLYLEQYFLWATAVWIERWSIGAEWRYSATIEGTSVASSVPMSGPPSSLKLTRVGTTVTAYVDGASVGTGSTSRTFAYTAIRSQSGGRTDVIESDWDNFVLVDGSSNPIYIDPTGGAC